MAEILNMTTKTSPSPINTRLLARIEGLSKRFIKCGFSNYETNKSNELMFKMCRQYNGEESLILSGKTGTGKTHLAIAVLKNIKPKLVDESQWTKEKIALERSLQRYQDGVFTDLSEEDTQKTIAAIKSDLDAEFYKYRRAKCLFVPIIDIFLNLNAASMEEKKKIFDRYTTGEFDCVCLDDLGAEKLTEATRQNLFYIIDKRYREMLPTIVTTNFTIEEIDAIEPRIASRLAEMGKILKFNGEDYRIKINRG